LPVRLRGVVTFAQEGRLLFIQDHTGGVFCELLGALTLPPLGHEVEILGCSAAGVRHSYVRVKELRDLGPGVFPAPRPVLASELWSGKFDGDFVRVTGYVARAELVTNLVPLLQLRLTSVGPDLNLQIHLDGPSPSLADLPGACVRIDGVCAREVAQGRVDDVNVLSARTSMLQVLTNAEVVLAGLSPTPIQRLLTDTNTGSVGLVRARGTVNLAGPDEFWLGDESGGINVWASSNLAIRRGEQIDLVGFLRVGQSERTLGITRVIARASRQPLAPKRLVAHDLFQPGRYGQVVQVEGEFLHRLPDGRGDVLVMREGDENFEARILYPDAGAVRLLAGGSRLRLTGVLRWLPSDKRGMSAPRLLVAEARGLEQLTPPPWPLRRTLTVVMALAVCLSGGLLALGYAYARLKESNRRAAAAEREVRELNAELEARIQRRTAELEASNASLSAEVQERRKALEALEAETRERETLLQRSRDGVVILAADGKVFEANRRFAQMLGYTPEELLGLHLWDWAVEFTREEALQRLQEVDDDGGHSISRHRSKDGTVRAVEVTSSATLWRGQKYVLCLCRDITERLERERALRESEERLRAVVEAIAEMVWVGEPGKILPTYVSPAFVKIWGRPLQYLYESPTAGLETIHPDDRARFLETLQRQAEGERTSIEYRILRPDGSVRWIWDQGFPVKSASGGVTMVNGIASDITERRKTEETLKLFRTLVDQSNDALEVIDPSTACFLDVSLRACLDLGYTREEMLGLRVVEIDPLFDGATWAMRMEALRQTKGMTISARHRRKDGSTFPVEVNVAWVELDRDYLVAVVRDITERQQAEEARQSLETQLRHAQKMEAIGTLAGGIAHDFNNILGSIVGYTELARLDCADRPLVLENLGCVLQASSRAKALIRQILAFSRPQRSELEPVPIASAISEAIRLVRATIPATIEIVPELGALDVTVLAEPTQLHQILINLATNAVHAMPDGGVLRIVLERVEIDPQKIWTLPELKAGPYVRLRVIDTGHGMNRSTLERIFEPFFTTKKPGEGTGLGLAVVHGIVQSCCGAITAESRLGEGSRFDVYLPALTHAGTDTEQTDFPIPRGRNERVLLVEDEPPLARVGSRMLESLGYSVVAFTDPVQALSTFLQRPEEFDLVVTDLTMPGLDGLKLTEEILRFRPATPVVLTTGFEGLMTATRAQALGVRELLQKPNSIESLGLALRRALEPPEPPTDSCL